MSLSIVVFPQSYRQKKVTFSDTIPSFSSILAKGNVTITFRQDDYYSITFKAGKSSLNESFSSIRVDKKCLIIDASKLPENDYLSVQIIAPSIDTVRLFDKAAFYTPTNVWQRSLYVESYSIRHSIFYVNATDFCFTANGNGSITLSGIIDVLYVNALEKIMLGCEIVSKYINIQSSHHSKVNLLGSAFVCECHANQQSQIDASALICGRAKAFALDNSSVTIKSEEKPIILSLQRSKIQFIGNEAIVVDSTTLKNIRKVKE